MVESSNNSKLIHPRSLRLGYVRETAKILSSGVRDPMIAPKPGILVEVYREFVKRNPELFDGIQIFKYPSYGPCSDRKCGGLLGAVNRSEVDASLSIMGMREARFRYVDYGGIIELYRLSLYHRKPAALSNNNATGGGRAEGQEFRLEVPFSGSFTGGIVAMFSIFLFVEFWWSRRKNVNDKAEGKASKTGWVQSWPSSVWLVFRAFILQDPSDGHSLQMPRSFQFILLWYSTFASLAFYGGIRGSVHRVHLPVFYSNWEALAREFHAGRLRILSGYPITNITKTFGHPIVPSLESIQLEEDQSRIVRRVCASKDGSLVSTVYGEDNTRRVLRSKECQLELLPYSAGMFRGEMLSMAFPKNSAIRDKFQNFVNLVYLPKDYRRGLRKYQKMEENSRPSTELKTNKNPLLSVAIDGFLLYVKGWLIGSFLGGISFIVENIIAKNRANIQNTFTFFYGIFELNSA